MKSSLTLFSFLFFVSYIFSQTHGELPSVASPSANGFSKPGSNNVDLYHGQNKVSIPVTNITVNGNPLSISLNYLNGGGVKVKDIPGITGMGWELTAGGGISRIIMGIPDEEPKGYCGTERFGQDLNTYTENTITTDILNKIGKDGYDGEPDFFIVKTPFFSFQFRLDHNGNLVMPNHNGYKIIHNLNNNSNYTSTNFQVIDTEGNRFFFGSTQASRETNTTKLGDTDKTFISTWFLDKIIWFNEKSTTNFVYASGNNYVLTNSFFSKTTFNTSPNCSISDIPETQINYPTTINAPKYLSKIETVNTKVDFIYEFNRDDYTNLPKLARIDIFSIAKDNILLEDVETKVQSFLFSYSYTGSTLANNKRLFLSSVTSTNSNTEFKLYELDYYNNNPLPEVNSKEFDYWGYYNLNTSGSALMPLANKEPYFERTVSGMLKSIKYLSGGKNVFLYEPNTYYQSSTNTNVTGPGIRVKKTILKDQDDGDVDETEYIYTDASTGHSTGEIESENYKLFSKQINALAVGSSGYCVIVGTNTTSRSVFSNEGIKNENIGYTKVITRLKDGSREEYSFTNFSTFPDVYINRISNNATYSFASSRQLNTATSRDFKRGLVLNKSVFNNLQVKIAEDLFEYASLNNGGSNTNIAVKLAPQSFALGANVTVWLYGVAYTLVDNYRLIKQSSIIYSSANSSIKTERTIDYVYANNKRHIRTIITEDSKEGVKEETNFFPADDPTLMTNHSFTFSDFTIWNELIAKNVLDIPVYSTVNYRNKIADNSIYFKKETVGAVDKFFTDKAVHRINGFTTKEFITHYNKYTSNIIESYEKNNIVTTYLWGYKGQSLVAKITGTDYSTVEAFINTEILNSGSTNQIRAQINNLRTAFSSNPGVQIVSYLYKPLVGVTTETDLNGKHTFYEYDRFNRLHVVKDEEGNVLKRICYNYSGEVEDCGNETVYYNTLQSGSFGRNDCGPGLVGSTVVYTVAANKYGAGLLSTANAMALEEISQKGQAYANQNGSCAIGPTNIYVRLELDDFYEDEDINVGPWPYYHLEQYSPLYIRFYSDAECTVPFTTTEPLTVSLKNLYTAHTQNGTVINDGEYPLLDILLTAGTSSKFLFDYGWIFYKHVDYDENNPNLVISESLESNTFTITGITNGSSYTILPTVTRYPKHPQYYYQ